MVSSSATAAACCLKTCAVTGDSSRNPSLSSALSSKKFFWLFSDFSLAFRLKKSSGFWKRLPSSLFFRISFSISSALALSFSLAASLASSFSRFFLSSLPSFFSFFSFFLLALPSLLSLCLSNVVSMAMSRVFGSGELCFWDEPHESRSASINVTAPSFT